MQPPNTPRCNILPESQGRNLVNPNHSLTRLARRIKDMVLGGWQAGLYTRLAVWTSIGVNRSVYEPSVKEIMECYFLKFSKGSKTVHDDDLGLIDPDGAVSAVDDGGYYVHTMGSRSRRIVVPMAMLASALAELGHVPLLN